MRKRSFDIFVLNRVVKKKKKKKEESKTRRIIFRRNNERGEILFYLLQARIGKKKQGIVTGSKWKERGLVICGRKTRLDADSRSQFPLATSASVPSFLESSYRRTISLCIRFPPISLFRTRRVPRRKKHKGWNASMQNTKCSTKQTFDRFPLLLLSSHSDLTFIVRANFNCTEILSISRILWFSEIANRKHPVSIVLKISPPIYRFEGDRWNIAKWNVSGKKKLEEEYWNVEPSVRMI